MATKLVLMGGRGRGAFRHMVRCGMAGKPFGTLPKDNERTLGDGSASHLEPCLDKYASHIGKEFSTDSKTYDVVIVGGGMVGAAVACGLATSPITSSLKVAIIDNNPSLALAHQMPTNAIPDPRVSAITPTTLSFLQGLGAWDYVKKCRHAPFQSMQVWDHTGLAYTRYNSADVGKTFLGYVVENSVLLSALYCSLQNTGFTELICPSSVKHIKFPPGKFLNGNLKKVQSTAEGKDGNAEKLPQASVWDDRVQIELEDGECLRTHLIVGADGSRSKIRAMAGIETLNWEYKQRAVICTLELARENSTAWQRFLPTGPLAILPMGDKFSNIVWSTSPEKAKELENYSDEDFVAAVNRALTEDYGPAPLTSAFGHTIATLLGQGVPSISESFELPPHVTRVLSNRLSFPLSFSHAHRYALSRMALVGDAAHTVHPLAGQGVNLGFGDAALLVKTLSRGVEHGADIGEVSLLRQYERERKVANLPMMAALDAFQKIFSVDFGPLNLVKAGAFKAVQAVGPLKREVISYAMGEGRIF